MKLPITQFLQPPVSSSLFGLNILLGILFSNIFSRYCSPNVRDQVSYPYTTTGKIVFLYIEKDYTTKQLRFNLIHFREDVHEFYANLVYLASCHQQYKNRLNDCANL
jgi:hypothetical protein